ncbi:MAG: DUF488 family protein [Leptolyngbya sp. PLA3]|nr:MAG: DUF488 family protein [Cyanobacteria bacterium CYA]MCE7967496.1 DUF488 family protein [Leptolyngbya sp. PL-A3]
MSAARDKVRLKRVYDDPAPEDGFRVLVDRLWPRGLSKARAGVDLWMKEAAPSPELRQWYHRDLTRWAEFRRRYRAELADPANPALADLRAIVRAHTGRGGKTGASAKAGAGRGKGSDAAARGAVTLLYGAKDEVQNHAIVLLEALLDTNTRKARPRR